VVVLEDVLDAIRRADEVDGQRPNRITHDRAVGARDLEQERVRPVAQSRQVIEWRAVARAGGTRHQAAAL